MMRPPGISPISMRILAVCTAPAEPGRGSARSHTCGAARASVLMFHLKSGGVRLQMKLQMRLQMKLQMRRQAGLLLSAVCIPCSHT